MGESLDRGLTGATLRAARALAGISAAELARESQVGERTILRAESQDGPVAMRAANVLALISAFCRRGVVFVAEDQHGGVGIRLRSPPRS